MIEMISVIPHTEILFERGSSICEHSLLMYLSKIMVNVASQWEYGV